MDLKIVAIIAVVILSLGGIAGLVISPENGPLIVAALAPTIALLGVLLKANEIAAVTIETNRQVTETHEAVNSRMTELLELTREAAKAQGALDATLRLPPDTDPSIVPVQGAR